jgi:alpha-beta hydrolase superfamily lysophospholipase
MSVELVRVSTRDGYLLDGVLQRPETEPRLELDAVCFVHGTGGNFYSSSLFDVFGEKFLSLGCPVLRVNTRGHDGISTAVTARGGLRLGAAFETVDDCRHDLAAWLDWLRQKAGPRVALLGHSLGAVKCLYAAALEPQAAPGGIIAVSPPRLSYSWFCSSSRAAEFLTTYHEAEALVRAGRPQALLEVALPLPFVIAAAGYVEKYGPDERYNYLRFLANAPCPTLVLFGSVEVEKNVAFQGAPGEVARLSEKQPQVSVETVAGADHFYSGVREEAWQAVEAWLAASGPGHGA